MNKETLKNIFKRIIIILFFYVLIGFAAGVIVIFFKNLPFWFNISMLSIFVFICFVAYFLPDETEEEQKQNTGEANDD